MLTQISWCLFWGFWSRHLVHHRIDNSSVCPFTDNDELGNHIVKALDALHATQRTLDILVDNTAEAQKGILQQRVLSLISLLDACGRAAPISS